VGAIKSRKKNTGFEDDLPPVLVPLFKFEFQSVEGS
jgi:hypothetical protein